MLRVSPEVAAQVRHIRASADPDCFDAWKENALLFQGQLCVCDENSRLGERETHHTFVRCIS